MGGGGGMMNFSTGKQKTRAAEQTVRGNNGKLAGAEREQFVV